MPTTTAVGVARPSAQGQATTSTATAANRPRPPWPTRAQPAKVSSGQQQDGRHKARRHPVGQALDGCFAGLGRFDQSHQLRQAGGGGGLGGAQLDHAVQVQAPGAQQIAGHPGQGHRLAVQMCLVDVATALGEAAVAGDAPTGAHAHAVTGLELGQRVQLPLAVTPQLGLGGRQFLQPAQGRTGGPLGAGFQPTAQQHKAQDGGARFEEQVHRPGTAPEQPNAQTKGRAGAHRNQHIHAGAAGTQTGPSRAIKAAPRAELHSGCQQGLPGARQHHVQAEGLDEHGQQQGAG